MKKFVGNRVEEGRVKRRLVVNVCSGSDERLQIEPARGELTYRCRGCGEMFRYENIDEILIHHQHALDAFGFRFTSAPLRTPNNLAA